MNVFLAGATGTIGRSLVSMLVEEGHKVVAMTRAPEKIPDLEAIGAEPVLGDVFDVARLNDVVERAAPEIIIHQLTSFGATARDPLVETNRLRIEGTGNLVAAARVAGARRFIAQSISFLCTPKGAGLADENTPLYLDAPEAFRPLIEAVAELERQTLSVPGIDGIVLRYGHFYGPGTFYAPDGSTAASVRNGQMPIVGNGMGTYSFIHVDDAAVATIHALTRGAPGIYTIVDDAPVPISEWLPVYTELLAAPTPDHMAETVALETIGPFLVFMMTEQRGASNTKAKRELGWQLALESWRDGFKALLTN